MFDLEPNLEEHIVFCEPSLYIVMYLDDDETTFAFVVDSLITHFGYTLDAAIDMSEWIDEFGIGIVATLPLEIAEQRAFDVERDARKAGFPLRVVLFEDEP